MVADDFNHDGRLDMAITNYLSSTISILIDNGNGTFTTAVSYSVGNYPHGIAEQ
ncbi:MAG: FG-GAP repeat domain-containing protein [Candidatus Midichloria sp.]